MLSRPVLLYDGGCGFCRAWVARLRRWDRQGAIQYLPAASRGSVPGLPPLSDDALDRAMHLVLPGGAAYAGGRAAGPLLRLLPGGRWVAPLLRLPGIQRLVDAAYRQIAARRHRLGCGSSECRWQ